MPMDVSSRRAGISDGLPGGLLRGHVGELALDGAGLRLRRGPGGLGDAEVDDLDVPVVGDEDVVGADVAVHHLQRRAIEVAQLVGVVQPRQHAAEHLEVQQ
jgi:hypothetical protein